MYPQEPGFYSLRYVLAPGNSLSRYVLDYNIPEKTCLNHPAMPLKQDDFVIAFNTRELEMRNIGYNGLCFCVINVFL